MLNNIAKMNGYRLIHFFWSRSATSIRLRTVSEKRHEIAQVKAQLQAQVKAANLRLKHTKTCLNAMYFFEMSVLFETG